MALQKKYKDQLLEIIHKHVPLCSVYLFGSRATNKERPGADIDIALDTGNPIPYKIMLKILIDIDETTIPVKVDLVDLSNAPEKLKNDVLKEGILWTN